MKIVALIALAACGSSGDPAAPPAKPAAGPTTLLGEAARRAKTADELIALARAYLAHGDAANARAALARVAPEQDLAKQLAVLDVRTLLGEEQAAALNSAAFALSLREVPAETLADALAAVESKPALAVVAGALAHAQEFEAIVDTSAVNGDLDPATPRWRALAAAVAEDPAKLTALAATARRLGAHDVATTLARAAAKTGTGHGLALELARVGKQTLAREVAKRPHEHHHGYPIDELHAEPVDHVLDAVADAILEAVLGDPVASKAWEAKIPALTTMNLTWLVGEQPTSDFADDVSCGLAIAALVRGERGESATRLQEIRNASDACMFRLADLDQRDVAIKRTAELSTRERPRAVAYIIRSDVLRGDLGRAQQLAHDENTGIEDVALAYAQRGDPEGVAKALAEDHAPTAPVTRLVVRMHLAWRLAATTKCDLARPLATELANAVTFAIVARYCER